MKLSMRFELRLCGPAFFRVAIASHMNTIEEKHHSATAREREKGERPQKRKGVLGGGNLASTAAVAIRHRADRDHYDRYHNGPFLSMETQ